MLSVAPGARIFMAVGPVDAYSGEVDRPFRRNVTGDSAESALWLISTRIGHVQSRSDAKRSLSRQRQKLQTGKRTDA